jgi:glycerophosphoryl diester phosphodiesterase
MMKYDKYHLKSAIMLILISLCIQSFSQTTDNTCFNRKPLHGVYVVAHRGAHKGIPENSLAAYQKAIDLGCDFVEIDVRTSKDGRFVSIHNSKIDDKVTGLKGKVSDFTFDELRSLDIGIKKGTEWKGTKIPSFEEILDLCYGKIGIYLDLKNAPVPQLIEIIKKHGMEKDILWYISASDDKDINDLKSGCADCILMPDPGYQNNIGSVIDKFKVCVLATDMKQLGEDFVSAAHNNHSLVIADEKEGDKAEWKKMVKWKTDGIQTDKPEELISYLKTLK